MAAEQAAGNDSSIQIPIDIGMNLRDFSCQSSDPHILDCAPTFSPDGSGSACASGLKAAVECSPGYPLTLRIYNPFEDVMPTDRVLKIGYPVIDTPSGAGYICDKHISEEVVPMLCKTLGLPFSKKLPAGLFGNPDSATDTLFVMEKLTCSGEERSVFECDLGPYGDHGCSAGQTLSVACAEDELSLIHI